MDLNKFSSLASEETELICPRTLGLTFQQPGSTISIVTNKKLDKAGFSSKFKIGDQFLKCVIPQKGNTFNIDFSPSNSSDGLFFNFDPFEKGINSFGCQKTIEALKVKLSYNTKTDEIYCLNNIKNQAGSVVFTYQTEIDGAIGSVSDKLHMFKDFLLKIEKDGLHGASFSYSPQRDTFETRCTVAIKNFVFGMQTQNRLSVSSEDVRFSAFPKDVRLYMRGDFDAQLAAFSLEAGFSSQAAFNIRAFKKIPMEGCEVKIGAAATLAERSDGDFGVGLDAGGSLTSARFGSLSFRASTSGRVVVAAEPIVMRGLKLRTVGELSRTRHGRAIGSVSVNVTCYNAEGDAGKPLAETFGSILRRFSFAKFRGWLHRFF